MSQGNPNFIDYQAGKTDASEKVSTAVAQDFAKGNADKDVYVENVFSDIVNPLKVELVEVAIAPSENADDKWCIHFGMDKHKYSGDERWCIAQKIRDGFVERGYDVRLGVLRQPFPPQYSLVISRESSPVEDAVPEVNRLRHLLRTKRIGKEAFAGGIATLLATGIISKSEFTRLNNTLAR